MRLLQENIEGNSFLGSSFDMLMLFYFEEYNTKIINYYRYQVKK